MSIPQATFRLVVELAATGERLDLYLARSLAGVSRKRVKRALDGGRVILDGQVVRRAGYLLVGGERLVATMETDAANTKTPPEIIFQDDVLLAINKPAGIAAHRTTDSESNALDLVSGHLGRSENPPILLHRLDKDTSGVLLFALTSEANLEVSRQFSHREVQKTYLALVAGGPPAKFVVKNNLAAKKRGRTVAVTRGGQVAETEFTTLVRGPGYALVEARPRTGRTHQIRAHLAGEGFPLLGDTLYGGPDFIPLAGRETAVHRHLLHAAGLTLKHPVTGEKVVINAPTPQDFLSFQSPLGSSNETPW